MYSGFVLYWFWGQQINVDVQVTNQCWEDILNREVGERVCPPRTMHRVFKGAWPTTPLARMYLPGVCGDLKR